LGAAVSAGIEIPALPAAAAVPVVPAVPGAPPGDMLRSDINSKKHLRLQQKQNPPEAAAPQSPSQSKGLFTAVRLTKHFEATGIICIMQVLLRITCIDDHCSAKVPLIGIDGLLALAAAARRLQGGWLAGSGRLGPVPDWEELPRRTGRRDA
jgi:hypothetical protein